MAATSDTSAPARPVVRTEKPRRHGPVPIADAYLLRQVIEASLRGLGWFAGLFLAFTIVTAARRMAQDDLPLALVIEGIALQVPRTVLFTVPASLLFGTVSTFTEMSSRGEITALMAGGMSLWRMLRGPIAFGALMAVFAFWLQEVVVPGAESRKDTLVKSAAQQIQVQENFKYIDSASDGSVQRIVQAQSFDLQQKLLIHPVIQIFRPDKTVEVEIQAQSARWDATRRAWIFVSGETRQKPASRPGNATFDVRVPFSELALKTDVAPMPDQFGSKGLTLQDRLQKSNYEMVSWHDLAAYRDQLQAQAARESGAVAAKTLKRARAATFGIHDKFATPLVCLAMILIGAPLGIRPQRSASAGLAMGLSLAVLILYYLVWTLATSWGKGGGGAPAVVAYLSFALTAGIGVVMVARKS